MFYISMNDNVTTPSELYSWDEVGDFKDFDPSKRNTLMESVRVATRQSILDTCNATGKYEDNKEGFEVEYKSSDPREERKFFFGITSDLYYMGTRYGSYTELVSFGKDKLEVYYSLKNTNVPNAKPMTSLYSDHEEIVLGHCLRILNEWKKFISE